ncbi:MAG: L,D-transpeptidase family protein [Betaproteobacteria bacterium]
MEIKRPVAFKRGDSGPFIADAQEMLAKLGFDPGGPEGVFVSRTEDAVRAFQREYGLEVTGVLDCVTLKLLYEEVDPQGYPSVLMEGPGEGVEPPDVSTRGRSSQDGFRSGPEAEAGGRTIVISVGERALGLYEGDRLVRRYPVAIGKPSTPTPVGTHRILEKIIYPGGGLGTRWMAFTYQMHGIHGTNRPELIGQAVSNGCVRMHNEHVEELYDLVDVGTPVIVIAGPLGSWPSLGKAPSPGSPGDGPGHASPDSGPAKRPESGQSSAPFGGTPWGLGNPGSARPKDPPGTSGRTYVVQPGDSLWSIARRFGTTVDAIAAANNLANPELIYPGDVLRIP